MRIHKAFTLVELLIASSIFLVILVTIYSAFQTGVFGYRKIEDAISVYQSARLILERMNLDLRNSFAYSKDETRFTGGKTEMAFLALVDTFTQGAMYREYATISYKSLDFKLMRLCRKNKQSLDEKSPIQPEEMTQSLQELSFEYGFQDPADKSLKFKDTWGSKNDPANEGKQMPVAVKIKLTLKNKTTQDFQRTIYLVRNE